MSKYDIAATLKGVRVDHYYCEDAWYSCPMSEGGCANDAAGDECNCGASEGQAIYDVAAEQSALTAAFLEAYEAYARYEGDSEEEFRRLQEVENAAWDALQAHIQEGQ